MSEKKTCISCNCKYMSMSTGSIACKYAHGLKDWFRLLLLGPRPLKSEPCEHFVAAKPKICKMYNKNITPSQYNLMGKCKCMNCAKEGCWYCTYLARNCAACLNYSEKTK